MLIKGIVHQFWIYIKFFSCVNERNIFYKRSISIKQLWLEIIEKIGCSKSVRPSTVTNYVYNMYNSTRSDWRWAPYFLNYFESGLFYWGRPFIKDVSFIETRKKCYIFKIGEQSLKKEKSLMSINFVDKCTGINNRFNIFHSN